MGSVLREKWGKLKQSFCSTDVCSQRVLDTQKWSIIFGKGLSDVFLSTCNEEFIATLYAHASGTG